MENQRTRPLLLLALALFGPLGLGQSQTSTPRIGLDDPAERSGSQPAQTTAPQEPVNGDFASNGDPQLGNYIRMVLDRNPGIREAFARYRAALQRLPQVNALPDPMLAFTNYIRMPETRVGSQTNSITFSQQFPWFGTLSAREQVAAKEAAMLREQYEAVKEQRVRDVKIAYYSLAFVDAALDINAQDRLLLDHYEELAEARYQQGAGLQQAVVKLQAEITRVQSKLAELQSQRVSEEASLNALLNRPAETPVPKIKRSVTPDVAIDYSRLDQIGRKNRPELLAALLAIERDEKRIDVARKDYWPGFTLGGTFVNVNARPVAPGAMPIDQNGKNIYSFNLGFNLPVRHSKYDAEVAQATEDKLASTHGYQDTVNLIESSIRQIGFRTTTLWDQIRLFNTTLIPQAQQALDSAEAAYSTGSLGVLDLLDSERVLLQVRLGVAQFTSEYMQSLAEMERAIGSPFPQPATNQPGTNPPGIAAGRQAR
jgi:outer membrane protein, heavy metal efflux system